jgi:heme exporter protein D
VRALDFSSWQAIVTTLLGIVLVSLVAVGIRLAVMNGVQQRHARQNRQINERLKTLIAAYKTLGGSFTGDLAVDPRHLRDLRARAAARADAAIDAPVGADAATAAAESPADAPGAERRRRVRDAVEAALSDVILLGTEEQVRLAARAANEMVAGRNVELAELVVSLRTFIREVLDLDAIPPEVTVPRQGPLRGGGAGGRGGGGGGADRAGGGRGGGGGGAGLGGAGAAAGVGMGGAALHHGDALDADEGQASTAPR